MSDERLRSLERRHVIDPADERVAVALDLERERLGVRAPALARLAGALAAVADAQDYLHLRRLRVVAKQPDRLTTKNLALPIVVCDDDGAPRVAFPLEDAIVWWVSPQLLTGRSPTITDPAVNPFPHHDGKEFNPPLAMRGLVVVLPPRVRSVSLEFYGESRRPDAPRPGRRLTRYYYHPRSEAFIRSDDGRWAVVHLRPSRRPVLDPLAATSVARALNAARP